MLQLPSLMHLCPGCFDSRGFQPVGPWKWLPPHFAPPDHRADRLPCQSATVAPTCCRHEYYQDQVLKPVEQTWMTMENGIRIFTTVGWDLCVCPGININACLGQVNSVWASGISHAVAQSGKWKINVIFIHLIMLLITVEMRLSSKKRLCS